MKKFKHVLLAASVVSAAIFSGCSPKLYTTRYTKTPEIRLAQNVQSSQTQGGITIELKPLDDKEYEKSFYKQKINVTYTPVLSSTPVTEAKEFIIQFYNKLTPFSVTITNNTDHILRMKDSRVVYIDPNSDEPVLALDKQGIKEDIKNQIPTYNLTLLDLQKAYPQTLPASLEADLNKALIDIINQIKFINGFNMEIMPGMKVSGTLLFPIDPVKISEGKISFIDMISKTDAAGNAIEKVRFDYKTNLFYRYWKVDPNKNTWVETNEEDYNKGQSNPEKYYYDKTQKKWILGTPPKK